MNPNNKTRDTICERKKNKKQQQQQQQQQQKHNKSHRHTSNLFQIVGFLNSIQNIIFHWLK